MRTAIIHTLLVADVAMTMLVGLICYPHKHALYLLWAEGYRCLTLVTQ